MATLTPEARIYFLGQVQITGIVRCVTGLHIGGADDSLRIGGIDKFVIKDKMTGEPYIPGSSFKGKMRSMLEQHLREPDSNRPLLANRSGGTENICRHECDDANDAIRCPLCRLMGTTADKSDRLNLPARLKVWDMRVKAEDQNGAQTPNYMLEVKTENALDRLSAHANPRTNERVAAGSTFSLDCVYDVRIYQDKNSALLLGKEKSATLERFWELVTEDLNHILDGLCLMEASALGGHGTRGYGKVRFQKMQISAATCDALVGKSSAPKPFVVKLGKRPLGDTFKGLRDFIPKIIEHLQASMPETTQEPDKAAVTEQPSSGETS